MKRLILALAALSLLGGCGAFHKAKKHTPTVGERIPILSNEAAVEVDPTLASVAVILPAPEVNTEWAQPGGNAAKSMGHPALGPSLGQIWRTSIGHGAGKAVQLAASPIFADGKIFTIDTDAVVRAINPENGDTIWETQVRGAASRAATLFGGGVAYDNGRVYATNGTGYAAAIDAKKGGIFWTVRPGGPLRGAPTVANDNVYMVTQDNQMFALNPADGKTRWTGSGSMEIAGVFGAASPAAAQGTVVAGFSSGELTAFRYENGETLWQDALARTSISTAVTSLSDVDASPVIDSGRVYAIGEGGRMVAIELITGQRIWELNIAGLSTPWVAGDWVFVVTDADRLLCIQRATGHIRWMTQLPSFVKPKKKKGQVNWVGPILAGGRLIVANSIGQLVSVNATDGAIQSTVDTRMPITRAPIVANNTLYVLHDNGMLSAWRG
jgi:outer membrane protein assembly factor BamB